VDRVRGPSGARVEDASIETKAPSGERGSPADDAENLRTMNGVRASDLLLLPVRMRGIGVGRAVDVIVDPTGKQALGFDVLCRDESHRFLPFTAATIAEDQISFDSPLMLLSEEQLDFYRKRARWLRELVPALEDAWLDADGTVELVISNDAA
jgi:hypothetical protein